MTYDLTARVRTDGWTAPKAVLLDVVRRVLRAEVLVGVTGALIAFIGVWVPAVWRDEGATIAAAGKTWSALGAMIGRVDVVHAAYYAVMHVVFSVFGYSPLTLRLPSALAVGATAALLVQLGTLLADRRSGITAGLVASVLPPLVWAGGEGRSYAFSALTATAATLALVVALRTGRDGVTPRAFVAWAAYVALAALAVVIFLYAVMLVAAHAVVVLLRHRDRRSLIGFAASAVAVAVITFPLVQRASKQTGQVGWLRPLGWATTPHQVLVDQWFRSDLLAGGVLVLLVVAAIRSGMRREHGLDRRRVAAFAVPWALVPTVLLLVASSIGSPLYDARYLTFTEPAIALVLGATIAGLGRRAALASLVAVTLLAAPTLVGQRMPRAKDNAHSAALAALVQAHRGAERLGPQGIIYGYTGRARTTAIAALAYPSAFRGLHDLTLEVPIDRSSSLWGARRSAARALDHAGHLRVVWVLLDPSSRFRTPILRSDFVAAGFAERGDYRTDGAHLVEWVRTRAATVG